MCPYARMNNETQLSRIKFYLKGQEIQVYCLRVQRLEDAAEKRCAIAKEKMSKAYYSL